MQISNTSLVYLAVNACCAAGNAYLAPRTFVLGCALGVIVGLGNGLKERLLLVKLEMNQKIIEAIKAQATPLQDKFDVNTRIDAICESVWGDRLARMAPLAQKIFKLFLYFSPYGDMYQLAIQHVSNFDEQRLEKIKKLNPFPQTLSTLLSVTALAAHLGYLMHPVFSTMALFSGYPMGYGLGKGIMAQPNLPLFKSDTYTAALDQVKY